MAECGYYRVKTFQTESREVREDRQLADFSVHRCPWCDHPKHSPVPRELVSTIGGASHLKCEGTLAKCPLSREEFDDVE